MGVCVSSYNVSKIQIWIIFGYWFVFYVVWLVDEDILVVFI